MSEFESCLAELGLEQYAGVFAENDVDLRALPALSDGDLRELGLGLGHRRILQQAIAGLVKAGPAPMDAADTPASRSAGSPREPGREPERRQLTIMFCDLVGSTALAEAMDPEELRELNRAYQALCQVVIERYDGFVARYMGDGVLAYFGYPQAHEDDAARAVRAGLELGAAVARLDCPVAAGREPLEVRIGIATGPVVVGDLIGQGASQESPVVGQTPNLAARLQAHSSSRYRGGQRPHALPGRTGVRVLGSWRVRGQGFRRARSRLAHRRGA
jgi:class 3 adenylate cyclase